MADEELIQEYSNSIAKLKQECMNAGMSEDEFRRSYFDSLESLYKNDRPGPKAPHGRVFSAKYKVLLLGVLIIFCAAYNFKSIYSCLVCNLQEYIYPGLRFLRKLSIPFISLFPALTELYHETCLIQNPFFSVADMDCWPCSSVSNVRQVHDPKPVDQQHSAPFIYETEQQSIKMETLKNLYMKHKDVFDKESPKLLVNNKYNINPHDLFIRENFIEDKKYYVWRLNNMNAARLLRQIIPRPNVVPKFGQSTERFIIIDTSQELFQIPDTECSFSFLLSLSGSREIDLVPAEECKHQCKTLKVELKESYLLWYNWWYWRPVVQPGNGNTTLIAHVGSYC